jgi:hypothetical protein
MKKTIFLCLLMTLSVVNSQTDLSLASNTPLTISDNSGVYITGSFISNGTTSMSSKTDASTGIYVVKLQAGHKLVTKKIIIN